MSRPVAALPGVPSARADRARIRAAARARRSAETDERRRRGIRPRHRALVLGVTLAVGVLVGMPAVLSLSPVFALRFIDVRGASPGVAADLRARLAPLTGTPLALVDASAVARAVAQVPAVGAYRVASLPPHTLQLDVVQRVAVAEQRDGAAWRSVDADGVVLATAATGDAALPEVRATGTALRAALAVLPALPAAVRTRVLWVGADAPDDVRLHLDGARATVVVWGGTGDAAAKSAALTAALVHAAAHASVVDVSSPGLVRIR